MLTDILTCYEAEGIEVLVLKGAALARLVYPQPLLRPMRDVDILVRAVDVLDWERVCWQYPAAWDVLPLLHSLSPWSDAVLERLKLSEEQLPAGADAAYKG